MHLNTCPHASNAYVLMCVDCSDISGRTRNDLLSGNEGSASGYQVRWGSQSKRRCLHQDFLPGDRHKSVEGDRQGAVQKKYTAHQRRTNSSQGNGGSGSRSRNGMCPHVRCMCPYSIMHVSSFTMHVSLLYCACVLTDTYLCRCRRPKNLRTRNNRLATTRPKNVEERRHP